MDRINIIGIDISKRSFQLHGATAEGKPVFGKKLSREKFLVFLSEAPPCLVVMEACGGAHHWGRQIIALGHTCKLAYRFGDRCAQCPERSPHACPAASSGLGHQPCRAGKRGGLQQLAERGSASGQCEGDLTKQM